MIRRKVSRAARLTSDFLSPAIAKLPASDRPQWEVFTRGACVRERSIDREIERREMGRSVGEIERKKIAKT